AGTAGADKSLGDEKTLGNEDGHGSSSESLIGTYDYMSPEARGELPGVEIGPRSDIYSFGVMLYRMLTGRRPVGMAEPPSELVPGISKTWDALIARCLKHDPKARFADGRELLDAIRSGKDFNAKGAKNAKGTGAKWIAAVAGVAVVAGLLVWWTGRVTDRAEPAKEPVSTAPAAPDPAVMVGLLADARAALDGGDAVRALEIVGQAAALDSKNADVAALRERIRAALRPPAAPAKPEMPAAAVEPVAFRFEIKPAGAAITLTHDTRGLVAETNATAEGVELRLAPGTYRALVTAPGFRSVQQDVEVPAVGGAWKAALSERRGELTLRTNPGAAVSILGANGQAGPFGQADAQGHLTITTLREGSYEACAALADHASATGRVSLLEGKPQELKLPLAPLPGRVKIGGRESMEIWSEGVKVGRANEWIPLAAGARALDLRCAGFRTERLAVAVPPNRDVVKQSPDLAAESGAVRISVTAPPEAAAHFQGLDKRVRIGSNPWKTVRELPYIESGLPCEAVEVAIEVAGYEVSREAAKAQTGMVEDGRTTDVTFALSPLPAKVTVTCNAPDATVQVGTGGPPVRLSGAPIGVPALVPVTLTVSAPGHAPQTVHLGAMDPAQGYTKSVTLEKQRGPMPGQDWTS
ncbi:MAG: hypothetical protein BWK77_07420, partial [Verrucomicrobia bacterium A1]